MRVIKCVKEGMCSAGMKLKERREDIMSEALK